MRYTGAGVLFFIGKYIVLYKARNNTYFEDLGGHIDKGEDVYMCAIREVYEESATYIKLTKDDLYNAPKIIIDNYICFIVSLQNFSIEKAVKLLELYKNVRHYNEMDDVIVVPIKDLIDSIKSQNSIVELRKRLFRILNEIYKF